MPTNEKFMDAAHKQRQEDFTNTYITVTEICNVLKVPRSSVMHARRRGMLPGAIIVPGQKLYLWERTHLTPYLDAWKLQLASRRGELK